MYLSFVFYIPEEVHTVGRNTKGANLYILYIQYTLVPIANTLILLCNGLIQGLSHIRLGLKYLISTDIKKCSEFNEEEEILLYAFLWVMPRRLNFIYRRFGTLCSIYKNSP